MKIGLFLISEKGFRVLDSILKGPYCDSIEFVCIGKDHGVFNDFHDEILFLCRVNGIKNLTRESSKVDYPICSYYFAISWRWMLDIPNLIVLHDSILPKYRGFAPLVNMLIKGEERIGATALLASKNFDEGPIIAQKTIEIKYPIKIAHAIKEISFLYTELIKEVLLKIDKNILELIPQNNEDATYSLWLDSEDYFIDWNWSAEKIIRKIDACGFPYDGAKCYLGDRTIIIESAIIEEDVKIENRCIGKVMFTVNGCPVIVCGEGLIRINSAKFLDDLVSAIPFNKFRVRLK